MLERIKRWLGLEELSEHERDALKREHRRLEKKKQTKRRKLESRPTGGGKKKEDPVAKRLVHEISDLEKRQDEIEDRLGEDPSSGRPQSRRGRPR